MSEVATTACGANRFFDKQSSERGVSDASWREVANTAFRTANPKQAFTWQDPSENDEDSELCVVIDPDKLAVSDLSSQELRLARTFGFDVRPDGSTVIRQFKMARAVDRLVDRLLNDEAAVLSEIVAIDSMPLDHITSGAIVEEGQSECPADCQRSHQDYTEVSASLWCSTAKSKISPNNNSYRGPNNEHGKRFRKIDTLPLISPTLESLFLIELKIKQVRERHLCKTSLRHTFELTPKEIDLCGHLIQGKDLHLISSIDGVTTNTLRQRLKTVFQKTDTHRQGELISLLIAFSK